MSSVTLVRKEDFLNHSRTEGKTDFIDIKVWSKPKRIILITDDTENSEELVGYKNHEYWINQNSGVKGVISALI